MREAHASSALVDKPVSCEPIYVCESTRRARDGRLLQSEKARSGAVYGARGPLHLHICRHGTHNDTVTEHLNRTYGCSARCFTVAGLRVLSTCRGVLVCGNCYKRVCQCPLCLLQLHVKLAVRHEGRTQSRYNQSQAVASAIAATDRLTCVL